MQISTFIEAVYVDDELNPLIVCSLSMYGFSMCFEEKRLLVYPWVTVSVRDWEHYWFHYEIYLKCAKVQN